MYMQEKRLGKIKKKLEKTRFLFSNSTIAYIDL